MGSSYKEENFYNMTMINLEDFIKEKMYEHRCSGVKSPDLRESDIIVDTIFERFPKKYKDNLVRMYKDTSEKMEDNRQLIFEYRPKRSAAFTAYTSRYKKSIVVVLTSPIEEDKLFSVFIHELGEVNYILESLPNLDDPENDLMYRIVELFSHVFIRIWSKGYDLDNFEGMFRKEMAENFKRRNYLEEYQGIDWKIVLMISWVIITFPELRGSKEEIIGYSYDKYKVYVDRIVSIVDSAFPPHLGNDFCSDNWKKEVRHKFKEVINLLIKLGMPKVDVI
jgi:hypothetical protein